MVRRGDRREKRFVAVPILNGCLHVISEFSIPTDFSCQKNRISTWMGIRYGWISSFGFKEPRV